MEYFFGFSKLDYVTKPKRDGCILCMLRDRSPEVEDLTILETDEAYLAHNLYPYNPGHLLIFPRRHVEDVRHYSDQEQNVINRLTSYAMDLLEKIYSPQGYNVGYNMGHCAGASIAHLHLHIIPRYPAELGIADLIGGKRVLVESPFDTVARLKEAQANYPFQSR
jgi:ATP adenylyltransferase